MPKRPRPVRVLSVADFHCGNISGLTPDAYNPNTEVNYKAYVYRRALNEWVRNEIDKLRPFDICVCNGDLIDGKGPKAGGREQIVMSLKQQTNMAIDFLKFVDAKEYRFAYGTGYHVGNDEDNEETIAQEFGEPVADVVSLNVKGLVLKWRHHINGSQAPTGRATSLLRQQEWDLLWAANGEYERADVMVFAHAHYFQEITNRYGSVFIQPALQGVGGCMYGSRRLGGVVDFGFLHFDISGKDDWQWRVHLLTQTKRVRAGQAALAAVLPLSI